MCDAEFEFLCHAAPQVGVHGLIINFADPATGQPRTATFLPEVAPAEGWTLLQVASSSGYVPTPSQILQEKHLLMPLAATLSNTAVSATSQVAFHAQLDCITGSLLQTIDALIRKAGIEGAAPAALRDSLQVTRYQVRGSCFLSSRQHICTSRLSSKALQRRRCAHRRRSYATSRC